MLTKLRQERMNTVRISARDENRRHHIAERITITELGNILEEFNGGLIEAGERISDLETGQWNSLKESNKEKRMPKWRQLPMGRLQQNNICITESEGKGGEKG